MGKWGAHTKKKDTKQRERPRRFGDGDPCGVRKKIRKGTKKKKKNSGGLWNPERAVLSPKPSKAAKTPTSRKNPPPKKKKKGSGHRKRGSSPTLAKSREAPQSVGLIFFQQLFCVVFPFCFIFVVGFSVIKRSEVLGERGSQTNVTQH